MEIRLLDKSDSLKELTDLVHAAYKQLADMGFRYMGTHQTVDDTARRAAKGECYIAVDQGKMIATVTISLPENCGGCQWYDRPEVTSFNQFAVHPDYQKRGIGSKLMGIAEERAYALGADELALDTAEGAVHLRKIYEKRGYRVVDKADWEGTNYQSVVMSKNLLDRKKD